MRPAKFVKIDLSGFQNPTGFALLIFVSTLCSACAAPPLLSQPNSVVSTVDGSVFVLDSGNYRVVLLSADNKQLKAFGSLGTAPEQIFFGWDLTRDSSGNLYFSNQISSNANTTHEGLKVFSPDGQFLREIGGIDYTPDTQRIYSTYGLDVDSAGRIYTADFGTSTVRVFDAEGSLLAELFGEVGEGEGQFNGVSDVAVDDERGYIYVSENLNSRVQQFKLTFENGSVTVAHQRLIGSYGRDPGQFAYPQGLAVDDSSGRLYVGDVANRRIQVFESTGEYVSQISTPSGVADWQVLGLSVGPDGALYVADALNNVIWVFEPAGTMRQKIEAER